MTTDCRFDFVTADYGTISIGGGQSNLCGATLTEEVSTAGDTLPTGKLELKIRCTATVLNRLIGAQYVEAYMTLNSVSTYLGRFYVYEYGLPAEGTATVTLVDIIGKLDSEQFSGGYYSATAVTDILNSLLGSGGYTLDSALSGNVSGLLPVCTKREALLYVGLAIGGVVNATRGSTVRIAPRSTTAVANIPAGSRIVGHRLTKDAAPGSVSVTVKSYSAGSAIGDMGSGAIPANSTATITFDHPGQLATVNGHDATDYTSSGYWQQMGITVVSLTAAAITLTVPRGLIFADDPWSFTFTGYVLNESSYTHTRGSGSGEAKSVKSCPLYCSTASDFCAGRLMDCYSREYIDEGSVLPGTETAGAFVTTATPDGTLSGWIERCVTDLYGGCIRRLRIRGNIS